MTSQVGKFMGYVGIGIIGVTLLPYAISPTRTLSHFRREKGYKMTANDLDMHTTNSLRHARMMAEAAPSKSARRHGSAELV